MKSPLSHFTASSAAVALLGAVLAAPAVAESVLVVPTRDAAVHVAAEVPQTFSLGESARWELVAVESPELVVAVQRVPAIADDGTVKAEGHDVVAVIPPSGGACEKRRFSLRPVAGAPPAQTLFQFTEVNEQAVKLTEGDQPVLAYNHGTIVGKDVPENDSRRQRACYIHPLWGLDGEILTDDFPRDHYHHHGAFWTWPHVRVDETEYDLWADRGGLHQKFVRWLGREAGELAAILGVENGWFVEDEKVMVERVWVRAYRTAEGSRAIDLQLHWVPVDRPITLWGAGGKSYGGLTVRFAPQRRDRTVITIPTGRTEADLPNTPLAWADFTSQFAGQTAPSGAAVFVAPDHPDFPPTWLTRHYGPLCVGWPGVQPRTFQPGEVIRLSYRLWIHRGAPDVEAIQEAYDAYTAARTAAWE
jgi:hypothetical protein